MIVFLIIVAIGILLAALMSTYCAIFERGMELAWISAVADWTIFVLLVVIIRYAINNGNW